MNNSMEILLKRVNCNIIFYISRKLLEQQSGEELRVLDEIRMTSNLVHISSSGEPKYITSGFRSIALLSKERELKLNVFELLKMKSFEEKNALSFLIDNYFTELDTYIRLTELVKTYARFETVNYVPAIQNALDMQHRVLVAHKKEIQEHFGEWKLKVDLERVFGYPPPKPKINIDEKQLDTIRNKKTKKIATKKNKIPLLTEKEVDIYLLNTVFGMDLTTLNNKS